MIWYWTGVVNLNWGNPANWNSADDGSGYSPVAAPWTTSATAGDTLRLSSTAADNPAIDGINIGDPLGVWTITGTCYIGGLYIGNSSPANVYSGNFNGNATVLTNGVISGGTWTDNSFSNGSVITGGNFTGDVTNGGNIYGGTFNTMYNVGVVNYATCTGQISNAGYNSFIYNGLFTGGLWIGVASYVFGGTFTSYITFADYGSATISGGVFTANNINNTTYISGGLFTGTGFINSYLIVGGTFTGDGFNNYVGSYIANATISGAGFSSDGQVLGCLFTGRAINMTVVNGVVTLSGPTQNQYFLNCVFQKAVPQLDVMGGGLL